MTPNPLLDAMMTAVGFTEELTGQEKAAWIQSRYFVNELAAHQSKIARKAGNAHQIVAYFSQPNSAMIWVDYIHMMDVAIDNFTLSVFIIEGVATKHVKGGVFRVDLSNPKSVYDFKRAFKPVLGSVAK